MEGGDSDNDHSFGGAGAGDEHDNFGEGSEISENYSQLSDDDLTE